MIRRDWYRVKFVRCKQVGVRRRTCVATLGQRSQWPWPIDRLGETAPIRWTRFKNFPTLLPLLLCHFPIFSFLFSTTTHTYTHSLRSTLNNHFFFSFFSARDIDINHSLCLFLGRV